MRLLDVEVSMLYADIDKFDEYLLFFMLQYDNFVS